MIDGRGVDRGERDDPHVGDDVVALALGEYEGGQRARLVAHVLRCADCRREYDELAAAVVDLLPVVPGVQPPVGFDARVLAVLATDHTAGRGGGRRRRWTRRRWASLAGVAAAAVLLAAGVGAWVATRPAGTPVAVGAVAALRLADGDTPVGTVSVSDVDGRAVMVVALVDAPDDVAYFCLARFADGTTFASETWPAGNGAWVVQLPDTVSTSAVRAVDVLPTGTDHVWSTATFPTT